MRAIVRMALVMLVASFCYALTPEEDAVLAPVHAMFDGMAKRDAAAIKASWLAGGTLVLMRDGRPATITVEAFAERMGKPGTTAMEERIHDLLVRVDHDLAVVWAPLFCPSDKGVGLSLNGCNSFVAMEQMDS